MSAALILSLYPSIVRIIATAYSGSETHCRRANAARTRKQRPLTTSYASKLLVLHYSDHSFKSIAVRSWCSCPVFINCWFHRSHWSSSRRSTKI